MLQWPGQPKGADQHVVRTLTVRTSRLDEFVELGREPSTTPALILDLRLPDGDGTTLLKMLRHSHNSLPVLVLTARSGVDDRVAGLRSGADDYLTKPFSLEELVARIGALLRRPGNLLGRSLQVGNVILNTDTREISIGDKKQHLSNRETIVLELLMRRSGNVVEKKLVEDQIFGIAGTVGYNAVEV